MKTLNGRILAISICVAIVSIALWLLLPSRELLISILIRLSAAALALMLALRFREWRILFLVGMFALMALRQVLTLLLWDKVIEPSTATRVLSEVPGLAVTLLALISTIYIGGILARNKKIISDQENDLHSLKELLPICSRCKKIRDDDGYWEKIEDYLSEHSNTTFTHGLCEDCAQKTYDEWFQTLDDDTKRVVSARQIRPADPAA